MSNVTEEYIIPELINISITRSSLNQYSINISEFFIINQIYKIEKHKKGIPSAKFLAQAFPSEFSSRRKARYILEGLLERGFLYKKDRKEMDGKIVDGKIVSAYFLTDLANEVCTTAIYILDYSREDYFMASQVIDKWNSIPQTSNHALKPYGIGQTKTVHSTIHYVRDIINGTVEWYPTEVKMSLDQILSTVDKFALKFTEEYLPVASDKKFLPKALSSFFLYYNKQQSEFFNIVSYGLKKNVTTMDTLKDTHISLAVLKKAYDTLSVTGVATEAEKLDIQKNIIRTHTRWVKHREMLDDVYSWKRSYREHVMDFNIFLNEIVAYVGKECGKGRAKSGFISFRQGNKLMEGFSKSFADSYHIFLWPTEKQKEHIIESRK